ncbi:hypothetical protein, partial [Zooshikella harenae]|nr:hypothetical protein [Zooshikella harenae]
MKTLKFSRLVVISDTENSANQFMFQDHLNLIISKDKNTVGKSTLVKMILWTIGCDVEFADEWKTHNF